MVQRSSGEAERLECRRRSGDQFDLGERARLPDDVDVALDELAVSTLLRSLRPPDRRDLDGAEHARQLGSVARVEASERNGEIEAQSEVREFERVAARRQPARAHPA